MKPAAHRRDTPALGMPIGRELPAVVKNENYALPAKHLKPMALTSQPPAPTDSVRKPLGLYGSCHSDHQTRGTEGVHVQCANMQGYLSVIPRQHAMAFFLACSRLYFLRIQRTR